MGAGGSGIHVGAPPRPLAELSTQVSASAASHRPSQPPWRTRRLLAASYTPLACLRGFGPPAAATLDHVGTPPVPVAFASTQASDRSAPAPSAPPKTRSRSASSS